MGLLLTRQRGVERAGTARCSGSGDVQVCLLSGAPLANGRDAAKANAERVSPWSQASEPQLLPSHKDRPARSFVCAFCACLRNFVEVNNAEVNFEVLDARPDSRAEQSQQMCCCLRRNPYMSPGQ